MRYRKHYGVVLSLLLSVLINFNLMGGTPILGESVLDADQLWEFVRKNNPDFPRELADHYIEVGKVYGIRGDMALCQAIIETGWFKFADGTAVKPNQHNYCGLGVVKRGSKGLSFKSAREGVTAQMQHLYAYASKNPLPSGERKIDKRFELVSRGSSTTWEELSGRWASNPRYGAQILALYGQMTASVNKSGPTEVIEETGSEFSVHRKYKNGNDRRNRKKGDKSRVKSETKSNSSLDNDPFSVPIQESVSESDGEGDRQWGTVGPVTARYLGLDLSANMTAGSTGIEALPSSVLIIEGGRSPEAEETAAPDKKDKKKEKKNKNQKKDKDKQEKGRKLPKGALLATPVTTRGALTGSLGGSDNGQKSEESGETFASVNESGYSDGENPLTPPIERRSENSDTVSVVKTQSRTVKIIRRR